MAAVMLFLRQTTGKTERHTHFCISLEPVFTRDCGGRVHFTDEPTGNLDSKSGGEVMGILENIWKRMGKTLVVITHDSRIARMADRQFVIIDGVLSEVTAK